MNNNIVAEELDALLVRTCAGRTPGGRAACVSPGHRCADATSGRGSATSLKFCSTTNHGSHPPSLSCVDRVEKRVEEGLWRSTRASGSYHLGAGVHDDLGELQPRATRAT
eukprot:550773-Rhodomonas_salina.1